MPQTRKTLEIIDSKHCKIQVDAVSWETKTGSTGERIEFIVFAGFYDYQGKEQKDYKLDLKFAPEIISAISAASAKYYHAEATGSNQPTTAEEEW